MHLSETCLDFFFFSPCTWIFSMRRLCCESQRASPGCCTRNGIVHLFLQVYVSLCKEEAVGTETRDPCCGEPGQCSGTAQGVVVLGHGRGHVAAGVVGITWALPCLVRHVEMGEAYAAVDSAGCKPHKAKYSKAVIFLTCSLNHVHWLSKEWCKYEPCQYCASSLWGYLL